VRQLPQRDPGTADPRLAGALLAWTSSPTAATTAEVHAALAGARVFVAIAATSTAERGDAGTGRRPPSSAEMALLTLVGSAGDRALPVFLEAAGPVAFRPGARPVPLPATDVCAAALQDGAVALLVDPPGAAFLLTGPALADLADGRVPIVGTPLSARRAGVSLVSPERVDPALLEALGTALDGEPLLAARLLDGPYGPVLGVVPQGPFDPAALAALAARVLPRLAGALPDGGLDLTVVPASGPGHVVALSVPADRGARPRRAGALERARRRFRRDL
jgi:hypothetical protein